MRRASRIHCVLSGSSQAGRLVLHSDGRPVSGGFPVRLSVEAYYATMEDRRQRHFSRRLTRRVGEPGPATVAGCKAGPGQGDPAVRIACLSAVVPALIMGGRSGRRHEYRRPWGTRRTWPRRATIWRWTWEPRAGGDSWAG